MSRFYGSMHGDDRDDVTRCGHRRLSAHIRGWNIGVRVSIRSHGDTDTVYVYKTNGSAGNGTETLIATYER